MGTRQFSCNTPVECQSTRKRHGFSHRERLYGIWVHMRTRCHNRHNNRWKHYGGRGIRVCPEWNDYLTFRRWALAHDYNDTLSIDRIDVDGDYCPENCRFVDLKTQANNTSRNHYIAFQGELYTISQLADHLGLTYKALQHRIERGWSMERISTQPQRRR